MTSKSDFVSIVIPNWNGKRFLSPCLDSLQKQTYTSFEIIVVDNGSQDGSVALLTEHYPQVKLIALQHNTGFSYAVNRGIETGIGEYIGLVNNDTTLDEQWLEKMVLALRNHSEIGSVACKMLSYDDPTIFDGAGDGLRLGMLPARIGHGEKDIGQFDKSRYVLGACGGAALYRKSMLDEIGLFDEDFFAYLEDVDLGLRAQSAGYKCLYIPEAIIYHLGCGTTGSGYSKLVVRLSCRNNINMVVKNIPASLIIAFLPHIIFWQGYYLAAVVIRGGSVFSWLAGMWQAILLLPKMLKKRDLIKHQRRINSHDLKQLIIDSHNELEKSKKRLHQQIVGMQATL